jgi:Family of unknown function (DUF5714)
VPRDCAVCGTALEYFDYARPVVCGHCGEEDYSHTTCPRGHYICDTCHNGNSIGVIEKIALNTQLKDPLGIAEVMMSYPGLPMLGCHHAYIAGGALMAALRNVRVPGITEKAIGEVFGRTEKQAVGGYCGLTGVCGIAPALGACFSIITGSKCGKDIEQKITVEAVAHILHVIADLSGPSCCKAYVRASLWHAVSLLRELLGISLPAVYSPISCRLSERHPHGCRRTKCPYFEAIETGR